MYRFIELPSDFVTHRNGFIWAPTQNSLRTIPGVGKVGEGILGNDLAGGPIRTTFQLIATFITLRTPLMNVLDHYNVFVCWLRVKGIRAFKNDIVVAMAGKTLCLLFTALVVRYRASLDLIEPPD